MNTKNSPKNFVDEDSALREEAKQHILKTKKVMNEFPHYPKSWLNKLICFRYKLTDPIEKQIRDYVKYEKLNKLRKPKNFDIIVDK